MEKWPMHVTIAGTVIIIIVTKCRMAFCLLWWRIRISTTLTLQYSSRSPDHNTSIRSGSRAAMHCIV